MTSGVRTSALVALAVAALAGCGGGSDGDPTTFGRATDRTCRDLDSAVTALRLDLVRTNASTEQAGIATALQRYSDSVRRTAGRLADAKPPKADAGFRSSAVRGLRRHADAMHDAAVQGRRGKVASALEQEVRGAELPDVPARVLQDAPACRHTGD
jgi:hypothetical protein